MDTKGGKWWGVVVVGGCFNNIILTLCRELIWRPGHCEHLALIQLQWLLERRCHLKNWRDRGFERYLGYKSHRTLEMIKDEECGIKGISQVSGL